MATRWMMIWSTPGRSASTSFIEANPSRMPGRKPASTAPGSEPMPPTTKNLRTRKSMPMGSFGPRMGVHVTPASPAATAARADIAVKGRSMPSRPTVSRSAMPARITMPKVANWRNANAPAITAMAQAR